MIFTKFLILAREKNQQLFSEKEMAMVGGSVKSGVSINTNIVKQEGMKGGKGVQERAEKMVKGSLGSILLPGAGGGGGAALGGGVEGGVKRGEKPQQQRQQQTGNNGTKVPRQQQQQQQQQQMANKPPQLKSAVAPKSLSGAESVEGRVTSVAELNGGRVLSGAELAMEKRRKMLEGLLSWHSFRLIHRIFFDYHNPHQITTKL